MILQIIDQNEDRPRGTYEFPFEFHHIDQSHPRYVMSYHWHVEGSFSVEIWKRFRKWGGIPSGLTQNVKDLLASREIENIFENSDFIYMLNQAQGDRQILAKQLGISPHQLSYVTHSGPGEGLLIMQDAVWNRVTANRSKHKTTCHLFYFCGCFCITLIQ